MGRIYLKSDLEILRRKSARLKNYDYSREGGYFVTLVTFRRENLFGEVLGGEMHDNALGRIVCDEWFHSVKIRKEIHLFEDEFIVMPNHIHGIVWIDTVGADGIRPETNALDVYTDENTRDTRRVPLKRKPKTLGSFIAGFKASVTSRASSELHSANIWQRNYYEHIIRNQEDYKRIAEYILDNPVNWNQDEENHKLSP
jgi:putative transposase